MPRANSQNPYLRKGSPYYQIFYIDGSGREQRKSTRTKQLKNARLILNQRRKEADDARSGQVDRFATSKRRPLEEFVELYRAHLAAACVPRHVRGVIRHLREAIACCGASKLHEFHVAAVTPFLIEIRGKRSATTHKHYAASLRAFGAWLLQNGLWFENPFVTLRVKKGRDGDRVFQRIGLSIAQLTLLAEAAMVRGLQEYARTHGGRPSPIAQEIEQAGRDRALLYWLGGTTALRSSEIGALTWADLHLDGDDPFLELSGKSTKNRDDARVPLQGFVARALTEARKVQSAAIGAPLSQSARVLKIPDGLAEDVRRDAKHAGIIKDHKPGFRRLDFHAIRFSCVRVLRELKVPVEVVQRIMRHSDIRLTLELYGKIEDEIVTTAMRDVVPTPALFSSLCGSSSANVTNGEETRDKANGEGTKTPPAGATG